MPVILNKEHKKKYSNYLITVNTQKSPADSISPEDRKEELVEALRTVLRDIFDHDTLVELVKFLVEGDSWFENVDDVDVHYAVSEGPKLHRIHAHAIVRIEHSSTINWDYRMFRKLIVEGLQFELMDTTISPHIDIKPFGGRNPTRDAKDYILKDFNGNERSIIHVDG